MKFSAAFLATVSVAAAATNPNLASIMAALPEDLVAAMSYFPTSFIQELMGGNGALPTDVNSLLAMAPGIPTQDIPKLSSEYVEFIKEVGPLLGTETAAPTKASSTASAEPTVTSASSEEDDVESKDVDASENASEEASESPVTSGHAHNSSDLGSLDSEEESDDLSDEEDGKKSGKSKDSDDSDTSGAAGKMAGSVVAAVVVAAAFF
ncbi:hypothetical protein GGI07_001126 [Coemansia sp. Benny D115]|nr:hypothetical protein GGI07_001126 [Coemansia sp. Benny D115]